MKLLPRSKPARRLLFGCLLVGLTVAGLYGAVRWHENRRQEWIEQFVQTTSLENNPWGIEDGMSLSEVTKGLGTENRRGGGGTMSSYSLLFAGVEHNNIEWSLWVTVGFFEGKTLEQQRGAMQLSVVSGEVIDPPWLIRLKSWLPFLEG